MKKTYLFLIFSLSQLISFGQLTKEEMTNFLSTASEQEMLIESSSMIQDYYYYNAEKITDKLLTIQPENANYNYRKGYLIINSRKDYGTALAYLEKAVKDVNENYDMYSTKEISSPPDAYYHLAACYHLDEKLDKAKENYQLFIDNSLKKSELIAVAQMNIAQCNVAKHEMDNPKSIEINNLGKLVNTEMPEYAPAVSLDGGSLYFTSRRNWADDSSEQFRDPRLNNYPEDIYVTYLDADITWTSPEKLAFCKNNLNEATISVSSDERRIYIYNDASGGGDIYYSEFATNKFEDIKEFTVKGVNSEDWETHCSVTPDGRDLYFVSNRPGGYGGRDIYRIVKLPNGSWSEPQNLGPEINSPQDEDAPFIAVDNKTLYYSTNSAKSMGGFDVFVTIRDDMNNWSTPVNMGYPINSTGNDIFYTTTFDGQRGYLSSFRKNGHGEKDIYEIKNDYIDNQVISSIGGKVILTDGSAPSDRISVRIECVDCDDTNPIYPRMINGRYFSLLSRCKSYNVIFLDGAEVLAKNPIKTSCDRSTDALKMDHIIGKYTIAGIVLDKTTSKPIQGVKVEFFDNTTSQLFETYTTDAQGKFVSNAADGKDYQEKLDYKITIKANDYISQDAVLSQTLGLESQINLEYKLKQMEIGVEIGAELALNPIYFDVNKSIIRPDAAIELDKIVKFMNENPTVVIELGSHTDCRASEAYNKTLSNRRAISSAKYIKSRITRSKRINGMGYGESQLVNDCGCEGEVFSDCSEEQHQANRRTEFKIIKK
jgi:outer membrane protein OmpA-like peptidoglycan-associated protein